MKAIITHHTEIIRCKAAISLTFSIDLRITLLKDKRRDLTKTQKRQNKESNFSLEF